VCERAVVVGSAALASPVGTDLVMKSGTVAAAGKTYFNGFSVFHI